MPDAPEKVKSETDSASTNPSKSRQAPMPWLKLWTDILRCPKLWRVTEALRARYLLLLCVACTYDRDGKLPSVEDCSFHLRLDPDEMRVSLTDLVTAGLVDFRAKSYQIHDWAQWQIARTPAAEKQKRYRDRRNALRNALPTGDVTRESRERNSRAREKKSKSEEEEKENPIPSNSISEPDGDATRVSGDVAGTVHETAAEQRARERAELNADLRRRRNGPS